MKYLIVKAVPLNDQYECDAYREPICITDNYEKYDDYEYEIYEICSDNTFKLIKDYESFLDEGMAIYQWDINNIEEEEKPDIIYEKYKNKNKKYFNKSMLEKLKIKYHFEEDVNTIYNHIRDRKYHGEEIEGKWIVIGEYKGKNYKKYD